jgi:AraC-like DNA-binding protein
VSENLVANDLSVQTVASHHGLTARYIHMLFEGEGMTFSSFVLEQRLLLAWRMLRSTHYNHMSISGIALAVGFSDVSHFNRSFRRRFGASPGEFRNAV